MGSAEHRRDTPRTALSVAALMRCGEFERLCIVENISPKGACLHINPNLATFEEFDLLLQDREALRVRTVWRSGDRIGVRCKPGRSTVRRWLDRVRRRPNL